MPVLGADPDSITDSWWQSWEDDGQGGTPLSPGQRELIRSPKVREVVNYFAYHPKMSMNQRFNDHDQTILAAWVGRKMRSGFTVQQLKQAISRFFLSWAKDYDIPVHGITSNALQDRLFDGESINNDDPIIQWIVNGMGDTGPFDDPRGMRSLLLLRCHEGALRYPEVVMNILRFQGSMHHKERLLSALEYIIAWNLYREDDRVELYFSQHLLSDYSLPRELMSGIHGGIRPASDTMVKAIERAEGRKRGERAD